MCGCFECLFFSIHLYFKGYFLKKQKQKKLKYLGENAITQCTNCYVKADLTLTYHIILNHHHLEYCLVKAEGDVDISVDFVGQGNEFKNNNADIAYNALICAIFAPVCVCVCVCVFDFLLP